MMTFYPMKKETVKGFVSKYGLEPMVNKRNEIVEEVKNLLRQTNINIEGDIFDTRLNVKMDTFMKVGVAKHEFETKFVSKEVYETCKNIKNEQIRVVIRQKIIELLELFITKMKELKWWWQRREVQFYFESFENECNFMLNNFTKFCLESVYDMIKDHEGYKNLRVENEAMELSYYGKRFPFYMIGYFPYLILQNMVACVCFPCIITSLLKDMDEDEKYYWKNPNQNNLNQI